MKHRKEEHSQNISICKDDNIGYCSYGNTNCWFNHKETNQSKNNGNGNENENSEVIQKLFEMMETFSNRLVQIENIV